MKCIHIYIYMYTFRTMPYGILIVIAVILIYLIYRQSTPPEFIGGSREAIFSRFNYTPTFPMISQLDAVDLNRFSKVYNTPGPLKFVGGRPYKYYKSEDSTWLYPWNFPHEISRQCTKYASDRCNEPPIALVKKDEEKLHGLGVSTPKDLVNVTSCFNKFYEQCLKQKTIII
jgi:hypothetical protein